jgi:ethanolamine permease
MTGQRQIRGVSYVSVDVVYFQRRALRRHAGVWSLWALAVGAVISGHYSGWNIGLSTGGWGGMAIAGAVIAAMYVGLTCSIAEMAAALPHTGGAYSFARTAMGPWGGFLTGLAENVEYVLTPAVIVFFIGTYLTGIFGTPPAWQPLYWIVAYAVFVSLNVAGVELSFRVTVVATLLALGCLAVFWVAALPHAEFTSRALNIAPDGSLLPSGGGPLLPFGWHGVFATLPFAVWLFLAIEQLPLAAEESVDPRRDLPRGLLLGMLTLLVSAALIVWLNPSVGGGAHALGSSGEPLLDGFTALFGGDLAKVLAFVALAGLAASFHAIIFAYGRQIYSLSRAGYFPSGLSETHGARRTPQRAMIAGAVLALAAMAAIWISIGAERGASVIGGTLLNMAVFGAMFSYLMQGLAYIGLRWRRPHIERPWSSPLGVPGAIVTIVIAAVTIGFQLADPVYRAGVVGVAVWFAVAIAYFALVSRHRLILSPEEEFALDARR